MNQPFSLRAVTSHNVFTRPGSTLSSAMTHKRFMGAMIILLVVVSVCTWLTVPMQMERSRIMLEQSPLSEYMEGESVDLTATGWQRPLIALWASLMSLLAVVIVAFMLYLFYGIGGVEGRYIHFFSLTINAALIGTVLPRILNSLGVLLGIPFQSWSGPGGWLRLGGWDGPVAHILGQMDIFTIWFVVAVALGVSEWSGMGKRRCLSIALGYLLFKSLVLGLLGFFGARVMGG